MSRAAAAGLCLLVTCACPAAARGAQTGRTVRAGDHTKIVRTVALQARCDTSSPVRETLRGGDEVVVDGFIETWVMVTVVRSGETGCLPRASLGLDPLPPQPVSAGGGTPAAATVMGIARISVNAGWQEVSDDFEDVRTFPLNQETAQVTASYEVNGNVALDIGGYARIWSGLIAGAAYTRFSDDRDIAIEASLPHPFLFDRDRELTGSAPGEREESAVHVSVGFIAPAGNKLELAVFAGPSFFTAKQSVVTDIDYTDTFPYDEVTFTGATVESESESEVGYHAGVDVGYYFTRNVGVGAIVRYSRANVTFSLGEREVGGTIVGGGLRLRF